MKHYQDFTTHDGRVVTGPELQAALDAVASDLIKNAHAVYSSDEYAPHVTQQKKAKILASRLETAQKVSDNNTHGLWLTQRINSKLTGECIAILCCGKTVLRSVM